MASLAAIAEVLKQRNNYLIVGHVDPDGDCIGSMFALKWILDKLQKKSRVLLFESPLEQYEYFFTDSHNRGDYQLLKDFDKEIVNLKKFNIIALDCSDSERLGKAQKLIKNNFLINIDHHPDNKGFGDICYVDSDRAAAGEIIYELSLLLDVELDKKVGTPIATAIIADTGSFRYENTSPQIFRIITYLMEIGVDLYQINNYLYARNSFSAVKLKGMALSTLQLTAAGKVAWLYVDRKMIKKAGAEVKETSGLVNYIRDIKDVEVGIVFVEIESRKTKVSLRSQDNIKVNEIAAYFGGGGHPRAAGCKIEKKLKTAGELVINEVVKYVEK